MTITWRTRSLLLAALVLSGATLVAWCMRDEQISVPASVASSPPHRHPSGLVLTALPPASRIVQTRAGFALAPLAKLRTPWDVQVRIVDADPLAGQPSINTKRLAHRQLGVLLRVQEEGIGSGGPLHTLTASMRCGRAFLLLTSSQQVDGVGGPDWSAAWVVAANVQCP